MPWNVFLLPLLGGFLFLDWCYYTRLRHQRLEGNRLLIESAFVAAVAAFFASAIVSALEHPLRTAAAFDHWRFLLPGSLILAAAIGWPYYKKFPFHDPDHRAERLIKAAVTGSCVPAMAWLVLWPCRYPEMIGSISHFWKELMPFDYSGTAAIAMSLGVLGAGLINYLSDYDGTAANVAEQSGDYILSLCFKAVQKEKPLTLILSNGRIYTGFVVLSPNLKPESQIALILVADGYLKKESSQPAWEAFYLSLWENDPTKAAEFIVILPTRLIDHAHIATKELDHSPMVTVVATMS